MAAAIPQGYVNCPHGVTHKCPQCAAVSAPQRRASDLLQRQTCMLRELVLTMRAYKHSADEFRVLLGVDLSDGQGAELIRALHTLAKNDDSHIGEDTMSELRDNLEALK